MPIPKPGPDRPVATCRAPPATLNHDVLLNIVALCGSHRTALALISTCRALNLEGAKILLRKRIWCYGAERFHSFLLFLSHHIDSRPQHVRVLHLDVWSLPPQLAQLFRAICPSMTNLESLTIGDAEVVVDSHPTILYGLAQLKGLKHFSLPFSGERVCTLLRLLHAPLQRVRLSWSTESGTFWDTIDEDDWPRYHPTILLENFADTLEEIECGFWLCTEDYLPPRRVYPRLRRLIIENVNTFYVAPYVVAFPNLAHISSYTLNFEEATMEYAVDAERFRRHRERNICHQLLPAAVAGGTSWWQRIQVFEGPLFDFYYLFGLLCPITRLVVHDLPSDNNGYLPPLAEVLTHARPMRLEYRTIVDDTYNGMEYLCAGLLDGKYAAWSRLETLSIETEFRLSRFEEGDSFAQAMEKLGAATRLLPLHHLKLTVSTGVTYGCSGWERLIGDSEDEADRGGTGRRLPARKRPPPLTSLEMMVEDFALEEFVVRLVNDMASLRDVEISITRPRRLGRRIATFARDGSCEVEYAERSA